MLVRNSVNKCSVSTFPKTKPTKKEFNPTPIRRGVYTDWVIFVGQMHEVALLANFSVFVIKPINYT